MVVGAVGNTFTATTTVAEAVQPELGSVVTTLYVTLLPDVVAVGAAIMLALAAEAVPALAGKLPTASPLVEATVQAYCGSYYTNIE